MFFPKLRRKAKWIFALLALAFALAFVVAGVGSGFGSGFGDYLADLFNRQPGEERPSIAEARARVKRNPNDPAAQLALGNALQAEGRTAEAVLAFEAYSKLRPNDTEALETLASLYATQAQEAQARAEAVRLEGAAAFFGNELADPEGKFAQGLGTDPITQHLQQETAQAYQAAITQAQDASRKEADVWRRLTQVEPEEANHWLSLGLAAQDAGDLPEAIRGYERYLRLAPDSPQAPQLRQLVKQLKAQAASPIAPTP